MRFHGNNLLRNHTSEVHFTSQRDLKALSSDAMSMDAIYVKMNKLLSCKVLEMGEKKSFNNWRDSLSMTIRVNCEKKLQIELKNYKNLKWRFWFLHSWVPPDTSTPSAIIIIIISLAFPSRLFQLVVFRLSPISFCSTTQMKPHSKTSLKAKTPAMFI